MNAINIGLNLAKCLRIKFVVDRTILKCSWDASVLERLGSEYSSRLVSKIVISSNERMVEPAPLDVPKSATQIMLGIRNAELWFINDIHIPFNDIHVSFSFSSLPTYPISSARPPEKQLNNLQWP